jgi:hypothetical protein
VLEVFPAFLMLARTGAHPMVDRAYLVLAVGAQAVLLDHFLHGGWVEYTRSPRRRCRGDRCGTA